MMSKMIKLMGRSIWFAKKNLVALCLIIYVIGGNYTKVEAKIYFLRFQET